MSTIKVQHVLERRLVFGDAAQIHALRQAERLSEWKDLPNCPECDGEADCSKCGNECGACDGTGKRYQERREFIDRNPGFNLWS